MATICVDYYDIDNHKFDKQLNKTVRAYKIGPKAALVLLAALPDLTRRVIPKREGGYTYVQVLDEQRIQRSNRWLVAEIDDSRLSAIENITRQLPISVYALCWKDGQWLHFPSQDNPVYHPISEYNASHWRLPVGPGQSTEVVETEQLKGNGLTITKTEKAGGKPWWSIAGDTRDATYSRKDLFKRCGCRWSRKRRQWYYAGHTLPREIRDLVAPVQEEQPEQPDTPAAAPAQPHQFAHGTWVYAAAEIKMVNHAPVPAGTLGRIALQRTAEGSNRPSYDVDFEEHGLVWCFEDQLTTQEPPGVEDHDPCSLGEAAQILGFGAQTSSSTDWYKRALDDQMKQQTTQAGTNQAPPAAAPAPAPETDKLPAADAPAPEKPAGPVITPPPEVPTGDGADEIEQALIAAQQTTSSAAPPKRSSPGKANQRQRIGQAPVGELSGDVTGSIHCFGYAIHDDLLVYLNMGGPTTGVEAIIGKLRMGHVVNLMRWDGPAIELTINPDPGDKRATNRLKFETFHSYLQEARFRHTILLDKRVREPNYQGGAGTTFIILVDEAQAQAQLLHHVRQTVSVAVFDTWEPFLWEAGWSAGLIRQTPSAGGIDLLTVHLDTTAWERLITGGLAQNSITFPENNHAS